MKKYILGLLPARLYLELKWWRLQLWQPELIRANQVHRNSASADGYSLKGFDRLKTVFVHIPKCGGISINKALFGSLGGGHKTLENYLSIFSPSEFLSYFKFTFVRNPWDRLVSAYFFLQQGGLNDADKEWYESELSEYPTFEGFVKGWLSRENIQRGQHFRLQSSFVRTSVDSVKLDFVGFVENMENDFDYILKRLNVSSTLLHVNSGNRKGYEEYYNYELIQIVSEVYEEDIRMFGYSYDNSNLPEQIAKRDREFSSVRGTF